MAKSKSKVNIAEGPIYTVTNYIFWFFTANLYFLLLNLPLIFMLLATILNDSTAFANEVSFLTFLSCITLGASGTALFTVMGKIIRDKDVRVTRDFFKAYKTNFLQSTFFWGIEMLVLYALYTDLQALSVSSYPIFLRFFVLALFILVFSISLYIFPIISRFYLKSKDVLKFATYYTFKNFHVTFLNLVSFVVVGFIFFKISTFVLLFMASIVCYLIMFYEQKILKELEETVKTS